MSVSEVVTSQTGTLRNRAPSRAVSLPTQVAPQIETVAPGIQRGQVVHRPGRSDTRKEATSPAVTLYKSLGKLSDILHLNNRNNQLERRA